ncbi:hypothetical protein ACWF94_00900 [Streptomyces sp. NPDC055078]
MTDGSGEAPQPEIRGRGDTAAPGGVRVPAGGRDDTGGADRPPRTVPGIFRDASRALGRDRRALYGFTLAVSAVTALLGLGVLALGFRLAWDAFEDTRRDAERAIALEEPHGGYSSQMVGLLEAGAVVVVLLLVLAALVLALLHTAHAVAVPRARAEPGNRRPGGLWRRTLALTGAAFRVQLLTAVCAGAPVLLGAFVWVAVDVGKLPGTEYGVFSSPEGPLVLVALGLPIVAGAAGLLVYFRLSVATAALVNENLSPRDALRRSWALTRGSLGRTAGVCLLLAVTSVLVFLLLRYAAAPVARPAGLAMLEISGDNVFITGVLVLITPTAVALLLLPLTVMPPVCSAVAVLYGELVRASRRAASPGAGPPHR